uniref:Pilin protein n=1 Tax=Pyrobaculum calidifontis TaxID=181486 RepID=UPI0023E47A01|nr:Chain A, Pilin protein [Pyrobaculum calidifontis]8DFT_B Chain B, Pilin protein [Pyrobaculum calidifontis]8DFT_C Chain C, Pilin protein [Pyrobaculum calidifontis]8DFT_D Chain D, Pilin protein [Pyrobaculum calidifontis]8DFT_E Chain E, Pilin protein [Pyrobaculum calidifontis]8DFT_F Chain F, Pilin protein [Pyrobaculum calidifontis]8DFT_G Chain G, Pilin protein [Pyrobaculum calidifontis]8DFT_H Chain H, Pilin protein [Pyrobaculum calidifontis]8DFT_I Chain I, Pilin protein [Pyrobaculum calidifo
TSVEFWQNIASGVGKWLRAIFAIAFWSSLILLTFYAIMTQVAPSKVFRLGALVDLIESVKTVLLGIFVFTASVTGIIAGVAAIANAFGASFAVSPIDVVNALIFQPIVDMVK